MAPTAGGVPQVQAIQQGGAQIAVQPPGAPGGAGAGVVWCTRTWAKTYIFNSSLRLVLYQFLHTMVS
jgi:hypothetical protein